MLQGILAHLNHLRNILVINQAAVLVQAKKIHGIRKQTAFIL